MKRAIRTVGLVACAALVAAPVQGWAACTETGFTRDNINMTAALINPVGTVTGTVDATGCNVGVYFDNGTGAVESADISGANYFGVLVNGDTNDVAVTVKDSLISNIGETPLNGAQHGVGIYYRSFGTGSASGSVTGTTVQHYQKGGIVVNGNSDVTVSGCTLAGVGPVNFIAQNGIQFGWGGKGSAMRNQVTGHSYTGTGDPGATSAGVLLYGDSTGFTAGVQVVGNTLEGNDIGVAIANCGNDDCTQAPAVATNNKVVNDTISKGNAANLYYMAGVSDLGNNDKVVNDKISGYSTSVDTTGAVSAKVHATK